MKAQSGKPTGRATFDGKVRDASPGLSISINWTMNVKCPTRAGATQWKGT